MIIDAWMQHPNAQWIENNDEVAQCCRAYPDRFVGIASVDLLRPMDAVRELRLRVKRDGFKGLRILPWLRGLPPDDRRYYPPEPRRGRPVCVPGRQCAARVQACLTFDHPDCARGKPLCPGPSSAGRRTSLS